MEVSEKDAAVVVKLDESYSAFDEVKLNETQDRLLGLVDRHQPPVVILDFTDTEYFSSVFFEVLFRVWKRIKERDGRFALCSLRPTCHEIMQMAKLDTLWDIYPSAAEALAVKA